jgi:hypothetical protein
MRIYTPRLATSLHGQIGLPTQRPLYPLSAEGPIHFPLNPPAQKSLVNRLLYAQLRALYWLRQIPLLRSLIPLPYLGDGREVLEQLAKTNLYYFHGSRNPVVFQKLVTATPKYKLVLDDGRKVAPTVVPKTWLSPLPLVAIFNATLRDTKAAGWRTFVDEETQTVYILPDAKPNIIEAALKEKKKGIVYIFHRKNPALKNDPYIQTEVCSEKDLAPLGYVTVSINDLPFDIRALPGSANPFAEDYQEQEVYDFFRAQGYPQKEIERLRPLLEKKFSS